MAWNLHTFESINDANKYVKSFNKVVSLEDPDGKDIVFTLESGGYAVIVTQRNYGSLPTAVTFNKIVFIGTGFGIYIFDNCLNDKNAIRISAPVFDFLESKEKQLLVAVCEIDIYAFDIEGSLLWHKPLDDIITTYELKENLIYLRTFEGKEYHLLAENGNTTK